MLGRLHLKTILGAVVPLKFSLWMLTAEPVHAGPATKQPILFPQGVDHFVKLRLELVGFQLFPEVKPTAEKAVAVRVHISPEVADQSGLHGNLRALAEGIFVLRLDHGSFFILDHLASPLSLAGFFSCACISFAFSKPFCAHSGSFFSSMTPRKSVR